MCVVVVVARGCLTKRHIELQQMSEDRPIGLANKKMEENSVTRRGYTKCQKRLNKQKESYALR